MTQANLLIKIDSTGAVAGKKSLDDLAVSGGKAEKATDGVTSATSKLSETAKTAARYLAGLGLALGVRELVQYTNTWTDLNSKLINATGSQKAADEAMKGLSQTARTTYSSLEATANAFLRNSTTLKELGYSMQKQLNLSDALNNSLVISGTKGQQAESVMNALSKAFATGKLSGENFNSVIANGGRTVEALADGLGVGTLQLRAMAEAGELTTGRVIDALTSQMETLRKEAEAMPATIGDAFTLLGNSMLEIVGRMDDASGVSGKLAGEFVSIADAVRDFAGDASALGSVIEKITLAVEIAATVMVGRFLSSVVAAGSAQAVAMGQSIAYQAALARMAGVSTAAASGQIALASASGAAKTALAFIGGPVGAAVLAAAAVYSFREELGLVPYNADAATAATDKFVNALDGLTAAQIEWNKAQLFEKMEGAEKGISRAAAQVEHFQSIIEKGMPSAKDYAMKEMVEAQANLDAATAALEDMRAKVTTLDAAIAKANFVGPIQQAKAASVSLSSTNDDLTKSVEKYLQSLREQLKVAGMSERGAYIYNATIRDGVKLTGEAAEEAAMLAGALYDLSKKEKNATDKALEYNKQLTNQLAITQMTDRAAVAFNATLSSGADAAPEIIALNVEIATAIYDIGEANRKSAQEVEDHKRATEQATEAAQRQWENSRDSLKEYILEFDNLGDTAKRVVKDMAAEYAASGIMSMFGMTAPLSSGMTASAGNGLMGSMIQGGIGLSGGSLGGIAAGAGQFISGAMGTAVGTGTSAVVGAPTAAAMSGAGFSTALAAIPVWGWAAMAAIAVGAVLNNDDGKTRENAGFFVAPTPGANPNRSFAVDQFDSGLNVQGFARRAEQDEAIKIIDKFREADTIVSALVKELDGTLDLTKATLGGLDQEATPGSSGTFLGLGGNGKLVGDIMSQIDMFVGQLADHAGGLDESLTAAIRSATTAQEVIDLLAKAVVEKTESDKSALEIETERAGLQAKLLALTETSTEALARQREELHESNRALFDQIETIRSLRAAEEKLMQERLSGIASLNSEMQSVLTLKSSIQKSIYSAMGIASIGGDDASAVSAISDRRDALIRQHAEQMRAEQQLHDSRVRSAESLIEAAHQLRVGSESALSGIEQMNAARRQYDTQLAAAQGGDAGAAQGLGGDAQSYLALAKNQATDEVSYRREFAKITGQLETTAAALMPSGPFDPSAANAALISALGGLDSELNEISKGVNDRIIAELKNINVTLSDLSPQMQETLIGAVSQWVETASPEGQQIIDALSGIRASVDVLPPEIASFLSSAIGQLLMSTGNMQRTVEGFAGGSLTQSAGQSFLRGEGFVEGIKVADAVSRVEQLRTQSTTEADWYAAVIAESKAAGVGSRQLADFLGIEQSAVVAAAESIGVKGFASGGYHSGGLRIVGENGPELEATGPSRIYNAQQTSRMMGGDASAEIKELRKEVANLNYALLAIAKNTGSAAKTLDRFNHEGMPEERPQVA